VGGGEEGVLSEHPGTWPRANDFNSLSEPWLPHLYNGLLTKATVFKWCEKNMMPGKGNGTEKATNEQ
jgi:hypothetical protein